MYHRLITQQLKNDLFQGKILVITGARQTGKTTLVETLLASFPPEEVKKFDGENPEVRALLEEKGLEFLQKLIGGAKVIFIDEAQKISNIGQTLKQLVDFYRNERQFIVSGSSSIHLLSDTQEPLTGRKFVYTLYPLSLEEIFPTKDYLSLYKKLEELLIFGSYPEVVKQESWEGKARMINELHESYLYKDVLGLEQIRKPRMLRDLLRALAFQIGSQVSYTELARTVGVNKNTVERYIDILEKNFVIILLPPFTKNRRSEIAKLKKVYFTDVGIRNAVIGNLNFLQKRNDVGALWENFVIAERLKYRSYHRIAGNHYFWKNYSGAEVDLVEERDGELFGFECKWGENKKSRRAPQSWNQYGGSYEVITPRNLENFII